MSTGGFWELEVGAAPDVRDAVANFLWEAGAVGLVEDESLPAGPRLRAFFGPDRGAAEVGERLEAYGASLASLGRTRLAAAAARPVADRDWSVAWQAHFRPLEIGRRLTILPPWEARAAAGAGRLPVVIAPGRAFGTGHHATTSGCLERLEALVDRACPATALDLGTGSGILAIAGALLGIGRVHAVDCDPDAIDAARSNAALNSVDGRLEVECADAGAPGLPQVPLLIANILAAVHRQLLGRYAELVADGGTLVLGGILDAEADDLAAALADAGFGLTGRGSAEGWTTLEARRKDRRQGAEALQRHP